MGDQGPPATCLSTGPHDDNVRDVVLHYFGCLRGYGREDRDFGVIPDRGPFTREQFFNSISPRQQQRIQDFKRNIYQRRETFEKDPDGRVLVKRFEDLLHMWLRRPLRVSNEGSHIPSSQREEKNGHGFKVHFILFQNSLPQTHAQFPDTFPNQKIALNELLYNRDPDKNPLMEPCPADTIRYFHFPANNMSWVEVSSLLHDRETYTEDNYQGSYCSILS
jgi:hypothetical protein